MANIKLTQEHKKEILNLYLNTEMSAKDIAKMYNVCPARISTVCKDVLPKGINIRSLKSPNRKLDEESVKKILTDVLLLGKDKKVVARKHKVTTTAIHLICTGENWPHMFKWYKLNHRKINQS